MSNFATAPTIKPMMMVYSIPITANESLQRLRMIVFGRGLRGNLAASLRSGKRINAII
jgi:hypothetical protein